MAQFFSIHPDNPQQRLIAQVVTILNKGGVIAYPTDSSYALGCHLGDKSAMDQIRQIRRVDQNHNFTLVARDLSEISVYARISNEQYRIIRAYTPGAYTFILPATRQLPRRLQHPKRKTIGIRIPDSRIALELLQALGEPIMSSTLIMPGDSMPLSDPDQIRQQLEHQVDLIIDGGACGIEPTTVIEWMGDQPKIIRVGKGDPQAFA